MDRSILNNKMINLDHESKVKFNIDIHGFKKDQIVNYKSMPDSKKTLIRRRFADNDGCIEIVIPEIKKEFKREVTNKLNIPKPKNGKQGSNKLEKENN